MGKDGLYHRPASEMSGCGWGRRDAHVRIGAAAFTYLLLEDFE